jgi:hypothetical protein
VLRSNVMTAGTPNLFTHPRSTWMWLKWRVGMGMCCGDTWTLAVYRYLVPLPAGGAGTPLPRR